MSVKDRLHTPRVFIFNPTKVFGDNTVNPTADCLPSWDQDKSEFINGNKYLYWAHAADFDMT
ncbi:hypothetical protein LY78DRAFT_657323 [Colletotrichum sublineola]|nr:hypothetical protein LY78DRAFT_657323 [Colletotrichum sublineola]